MDSESRWDPFREWRQSTSLWVVIVYHADRFVSRTDPMTRAEAEAVASRAQVTQWHAGRRVVNVVMQMQEPK